MDFNEYVENQTSKDEYKAYEVLQTFPKENIKALKEMLEKTSYQKLNVLEYKGTKLYFIQQIIKQMKELTKNYEKLQLTDRQRNLYRLSKIKIPGGIGVPSTPQELREERIINEKEKMETYIDYLQNLLKKKGINMIVNPDISEKNLNQIIYMVRKMKKVKTI